MRIRGAHYGSNEQEDDPWHLSPLDVLGDEVGSEDATEELQCAMVELEDGKQEEKRDQDAKNMFCCWVVHPGVDGRERVRNQ